MALDIDALVAPLSEEEPSGPDLYADPDRAAIEQAFERSVSEDTTGAGGDLDWNDVIRRITAQGETTRDLWLPVYMMRAGAIGQKFDRVQEGAEWLARLLEDRWADVHPQLDEVGFIGRKTPCESLTRLGEFLTPLLRVPVLSHARLGSYSGLDFQRFLDEGGSAENYGMFRALLDETPGEQLTELVGRIDSLTEAIRRADRVMTDNAEGDTSTNFDPTYEVLKKLRRAVAAFAPEDKVEEPVEEAPAETAKSGGQTGKSGQDGPGFSGAITNRSEVVRALDAICAYYSKFEPNSPVPLALRRVREWTSLDFMAVLEDIAPGGITEAGLVLKSQRSPGSSAGSDNSSWGNDGGGSGSGGSQSSSSSNDDGW